MTCVVDICVFYVPERGKISEEIERACPVHHDANIVDRTSRQGHQEDQGKAAIT